MSPTPQSDPDYDINPAACGQRHRRTGVVTNQDPDEPYDQTEPCIVLTVCHREECREKSIRKVAGGTNRRATYYDDAERRTRRLQDEAKRKCDGSTSCSVPMHVHGCFADVDGASCDDPTDHVGVEPTLYNRD